jgi:alpha-glucosidase (family GH31 glycosyl hydrolase)
MNRFTLTVLFTFFLSFQVFSQEKDTVIADISTDSTFLYIEGGIEQIDTTVNEPLKVKSPTKALMFALVLPGLGQAYNEKYYKIPIVWAALGAAGYAIVYNTRQYEEYSIKYINDKSTLNERYLKYTRRNMELSYIVAIMVYGLQILDAYVDANLYSWDVNDNLSMGITPSLQPLMVPDSHIGYSGGLTCSFKIRGR